LGGRSERVVRRVLDAAIVELAQSGYHRFRMDVVASQAAVNKTYHLSALAQPGGAHRRGRRQNGKPFGESPLPDTGRLESDLVEAFARRFTFGRKTEGRAWARLIDERYNPEVEAIIKDAGDERRSEWRSMVTSAIERGELPPGTDPQLVLDFVRAIVDSRSSSRGLDRRWLTLAVRNVVAGARARTLVRGEGDARLGLARR
jgi:AcrR family transcriptional regulator